VSAPTFIDLFSGCGGFTLAMLRAGFECLAAVDFNKKAVATLRANLPTRTPTDSSILADAVHSSVRILHSPLVLLACA
jgi:DNA (cytosine-5)-methyltransferase 1